MSVNLCLVEADDRLVDQAVVDQKRKDHLLLEGTFGALEGWVGAKVIIEVFGGALFIQVGLPLKHFSIAELTRVVCTRDPCRSNH